MPESEGDQPATKKQKGGVREDPIVWKYFNKTAFNKTTHRHDVNCLNCDAKWKSAKVDDLIQHILRSCPDKEHKILDEDKEYLRDKLVSIPVLCPYERGSLGFF
jgi:hypothetical protein